MIQLTRIAWPVWFARGGYRNHIWRVYRVLVTAPIERILDR